jgi:hypothetical protein
MFAEANLHPYQSTQPEDQALAVGLRRARKIIIRPNINTICPSRSPIAKEASSVSLPLGASIPEKIKV